MHDEMKPNPPHPSAEQAAEPSAVVCGQHRHGARSLSPGATAKQPEEDRLLDVNEGATLLGLKPNG